jgi:heat shock protein HtpX
VSFVRFVVRMEPALALRGVVWIIGGMWEAIASNKRKSIVLITVMGMLMILVGLAIGGAMGGEEGVIVGGVIALVMWIVMTLVSYYGGDSLFLASAGAKQIEHSDHETLFNIVEEMCVACGLATVPKVYIIDDPRPNAFAVGRDPEHASVAVTAGLLNRLNRDELQGVIAHELAHIQNRDILYVMVAAVMVGVIALLSDFFLRYLWFSGGRRSSRRDNGQAQMVLMVAGILLAILGPIAAQLLYFALSRRREYLADACGAQYTRYPEGLASALEKIAQDPGMSQTKNRAMAPMYIVPPRAATAFAAAGLTSTHPPTQKRIGILRAMGGASLADYEKAYRNANGGSMVPAGAVKASRPVGVRPPWHEDEQQKKPKEDAREKARETSDLLFKLNKFIFLNCACGARLKVPPTFKSPKVKCPRCDRVHEVAKG